MGGGRGGSRGVWGGVGGVCGGGGGAGVVSGGGAMPVVAPARPRARPTAVAGVGARSAGGGGRSGERGWFFVSGKKVQRQGAGGWGLAVAAVAGVYCIGTAWREGRQSATRNGICFFGGSVWGKYCTAHTQSVCSGGSDNRNPPAAARPTAPTRWASPSAAAGGLCKKKAATATAAGQWRQASVRRRVRAPPRRSVPPSARRAPPVT